MVVDLLMHDTCKTANANHRHINNNKIANIKELETKALSHEGQCIPAGCRHGQRNRGVWGTMPPPPPLLGPGGTGGTGGRSNENDLCIYSRQSLFSTSLFEHDLSFALHPYNFQCLAHHLSLSLQMLNMPTQRLW